MEITAAFVLEKGGDFILQKMQLETPRADEVLIKIVGIGTCHTDMAARDNIMGVPNFPVILGHEGSGIVEEVGSSSVTKVKKGDHVVLTLAIAVNVSTVKAESRPIVSILWDLILQEAALMAPIATMEIRWILMIIFSPSLHSQLILLLMKIMWLRFPKMRLLKF
ncbi:MAG: alcohol dehydrogenase catalytic domain-containing protein [Flavobacterium circumlabens]|uniref:alcohol dehydrogenase catalytic domain-containing protein n=1 Tax=Flavobacterium circumlabens TaxID=2133765 RepID=UPI0032670E56